MKLYCCNFLSSSAPAIKPVLNLTETPKIVLSYTVPKLYRAIFNNKIHT